MDLIEMDAIGGSIDEHWYYLSKLAMIERHVGSNVGRIIDVGAGAGWFSRMLLKRGKASDAICVDPGYPAECDEHVNGGTLAFRRRYDGSEANLILMMDVLEHVEDDIKLLTAYVTDAAPGTRFLITVPAFEVLWSAHDDYLQHHRRYTLKRLRDVVCNAGLTEIRSHYYFASILPAAALVRLFRRRAKANRSDMRPVPRWVGAALKAVLAIEAKYTHLNRLAGLTVVCLCRK